MRVWRIGAACVALVLAWTFVRAAQPQQQTPFVTAVFRHLAAWDRDRDDRLSLEEIDAGAVLDASITGDDAAAAGTLKLMARRKEMKDIALSRGCFKRSTASDWKGSSTRQTRRRSCRQSIS